MFGAWVRLATSRNRSQVKDSWDGLQTSLFQYFTAQNHFSFTLIFGIFPTNIKAAEGSGWMAARKLANFRPRLLSLQSPWRRSGSASGSSRCWGCSADMWGFAGSSPAVLSGWSWKAQTADNADRWAEPPGATSSRLVRLGSPRRPETL